MRRLGLRLKFALVIVVLFAIIFGVIAAILVKQNSHSLRDDLNNKSKLFAALATTPIGNAFLTYQDSGQIKITQQIQSFTDLSHEVTDVAVVDTDGKVAFNQNPKQAVVVDQTTSTTFMTVYSSDKNGIISRIVVPLIEDNGSHRYNLVYYISSASVIASIHSTELSIILFIVIGLLASIIITYILTSQLFVNPVRKLSTQALLVSAGHLEQQVKANSRDEVGDLAQAVNKMAESLEADIVKLREVDRLKTEFLMIASHNLRTPLSIINGYLEQLGSFEVSSQLRKILNTISVSGKRLGAFAEDILTVSQLEAGDKVLDMSSIELNSLVVSMARDFAVLANQKNIVFMPSINLSGVIAEVSPPHLKSALWNLLDNALKFTNTGGKISLNALVINNQVQISISDTGIGITKEELPKLFTKFHRGTSTWDYQYEGSGIGLYATKLVIERMGGQVTVASRYGHGTTFTISLPIAKTL